MLVDALADAIPAWRNGQPLPEIAFTPADASFCADSLLRRISEGSDWYAHYRSAGDTEAAARRVRDDLVRICTANLLMIGLTRPRRADAIRAFRDLYRPPAALKPVLDWAEHSFGPAGTDEDSPVDPPAEGLNAAAAAIDRLRDSMLIT